MKQNVYYVYSLQTKECPLPFYIGYGKGDAVRSPIKKGRLVTENEMLRRLLDKKDILTSRIIVESLYKHDAQRIATECLVTIKSIGGCPLQKPEMIIDEHEEVIGYTLQNYFAELYSFTQIISFYYDKFIKTASLHYRRIVNARERIVHHRGSNPNREFKVVPHDPFGEFSE